MGRSQGRYSCAVIIVVHAVMTSKDLMAGIARHETRKDILDGLGLCGEFVCRLRRISAETCLRWYSLLTRGIEKPHRLCCRGVLFLYVFFAD